MNIKEKIMVIAERCKNIKAMRSVKGILCVLCAGMCWGTTGTIQAFTPPGASSLTVGAARIVFAGIILFVLMFIKKRRALFSGTWNIKGVILAAVGLAAYQLTFFSAVRLTGVAVGTMVTVGSSPLLAGIFGQMLFGERLTLRWRVATVMAIAGCIMLVLGGSSGAFTASFLGIILALGAALSYALEGVGLRLIKQGPYEVIAVVSGLSALIALPWLITGDISWMLQPRGALCVLLLAVLSTVIPCTLFTVGIQNLELGIVYTLSLSEPLMAWFLSTVLLGERLTRIGLLGVAILFSGIMLIALKKNSTNS